MKFGELVLTCCLYEKGSSGWLLLKNIAGKRLGFAEQLPSIHRPNGLVKLQKRSAVSSNWREGVASMQAPQTPNVGIKGHVQLPLGQLTCGGSMVSLAEPMAPLSMDNLMSEDSIE